MQGGALMDHARAHQVRKLNFALGTMLGSCRCHAMALGGRPDLKYDVDEPFTPLANPLIVPGAVTTLEEVPVKHEHVMFFQPIAFAIRPMPRTIRDSAVQLRGQKG